MKTKTFRSKDGLDLIVKSRKSSVIFEVSQQQLSNTWKSTFIYNHTDFLEVYNYLVSVSSESWSNINPQEADSIGSDYYEYYDKELDNNGYLSLRLNEFHIDRPDVLNNKLYQFNKRKMESFIFDYNKLINE